MSSFVPKPFPRVGIPSASLSLAPGEHAPLMRLISPFHTGIVAGCGRTTSSNGCRCSWLPRLFGCALLLVVWELCFPIPGACQSGAPVITSGNSTTFTETVAGSFTVTATGTPTPTLSESGTLPTGVSFNAGSGVLSGTPAAGTAGSYPITFTAQNTGTANNVLVQKKDTYFGNGSGAGTKSIVFTSQVAKADLLFCMVGWETANGSVISSVSDSVGNTYTALPLVVNSPHQMQGFYAFSSGSGADTVTVNFSGAGGTYVGIACGEWSGPTHLDVHGERFGISATPSSATVTPTSSGELLIGYADDAVNAWGATGGWTILTTSSGVRYGLEEQLSSTTGGVAAGFTISTAPWAAGIAAFSSSQSFSATQNFTLIVNPMPVAPTITSGNNATFTVGTAGSFMVTATGVPAPTLSETGALPAGVTFNAASGVLGGTPTVGGTYPVTITAQNGVGTGATQSFTLAVNQAAAITSGNNAAFTVGAAGSFTVTANGFPSPTLSESGALPAGVTFNAASGVLGGTPTVGGAYPVTFTAHNGVGTDATQNFTLTVTAYQAPAITSGNSTTFTETVAGSFTVTATGTPTPTLSESGTLPTGVSFNAGSGVLSGTPAAGTAGSYPITFTAQNTGTANNVLVQKKDTYFGNGSGAGTKSIVFTSQVAKADLLFCMVGWETANGSVISSVSDSVGNTYTALPLVVNSPHQMQGFYAFSSGSGADTVTVNFSGAGGTYVGIACGEWSGPTHLDVHGERFGISATPSSATVTPTSSGELLIGYADDAVNAWGATGGWTILTTSSGVRYGLEEQLSSTTGGVAAGFTISTAPWAAGIAAFGGSSGATQSFTLIVNPMAQTTPTITWATPAAMPYGTALSATQLNATASVPGTFVYTPAAGTIPGVGTTTLSVTFTPTDSIDYTSATKTVTLTVNQATPTITWATPAAIPYGTALSATQLNATASVPGTFVYTPAAGTIPGVGTTTLSVTFTPTDSIDYTSATKTVTLTVNQATPTITWATPAAIPYGTALSGTQLNATASAPGTFVYTPAAGTVPSAENQTLSVTFTPTDSTNYTTAIGTVTLTVDQATPTITWATPAGILYGTALTATQLNATASAPGSVSAPPTTTPTLVQHVSTGRENTGGANPSLRVTLPNPTLAGNALILGVEGDSSLAIATPTDDRGNTWIAGPFISSGGETIASFYALNVAAGTQVITTGYTGNATPSGISAVLSEFNNVQSPGPIGPTGSVRHASPVSITLSGSPAPGDLVWMWGADTASIDPVLTNIAAGANFTLLSANREAGKMAQYSTSTSSPTASFTTSGSDPFNAVALTLHAATAGNVAGSGIRIVHMQGEWYDTTTHTAQFPSSGNLLVISLASTGVTISAVSDSNGNTWSLGAAAITSGETTQIMYAANAKTSPDMIIHLTYSGASQGLNFVHFYDISGALTSPHDVDDTRTGNQTTSGNLTTGVITPSQANSLVLNVTSIFWHTITGTVTDANGHTPTLNQAVDSLDNNTINGTPPSHLDDDDARASFYNNDTSQISFAYAATSANSPAGVGSWASVTSVFKGVSPEVVVPGTFVYSPAAGAVPNAGSQTLSVTFMPTDSVDYTSATKTVTLMVTQATPIVTWSTPAAMPYGTALSATQLNATASVPGTFVYTPAAGTIPGVGTTTLSVTFTPTDSIDYTSATKTVTLTVNQATPTITWATPAAIPYGTALSATQLNATASMPGTFVYTPAAGTIPGVGTTTLSVTFTPTDSIDYTSATKTVTLTVNQATPTITWATPAAIPYGTALSGTQLNATASVPGTFVYTPTAGTVPSAGNQTLSVTFTPTDSTDYTTAIGTVTLAVDLGPSITSAGGTSFTVGTPGSFTVTVNGFPSATLSESGALPSGVSFNAATGVLGGTPTVSGTYPVTFTAHNGVGTDATQSFTLMVNSDPVAPSITSVGSTSFAVGTPGSFTVTATGIPAPTLSESGALPAGVTFNAASGVLGGTPTVGGAYPVTFTAHNGVGTDATQNFTLTVTAYQAPAITSGNSTTFTETVAGSFTVTATGTPTPTLSESGTLPTGVSFNAGSGVLSGTPAAGTAGSYPITFTAQNTGTANNVLVQKKDTYFGNGSGAGTKSIVFTSQVAKADLLFCMVGWETANGSVISSVSDSVGNTYTALPLVVNSPHQMQGFYAFSSGSGADTVTVNFSGAGGTYVGIACGEWSGPTHLDVHGERFGISATPSSATVTPTSSGELLIGYADDAVNAWGATGGWTILTTSSGVRYGLEEQLSSTTGGVAAGFTISTAPWAAGIAAFSSSQSFSATQNFTLIVNPMPVAPTITSGNNATFTVGTAGSFMVTATGVPAPTLSETGALPAGVTFNAASGVLGGTPTVGGTYPVTITAQNGVGTGATQSFTLAVNQAAAITSGNNAAFTVGAAGSFTVTANGFPSPTLSESGALPAGVTFNAASGVLGGTPTVGGAYPVTFTAHNGVGTDATQNFTLTVTAYQAPAITSGNSTTFTETVAGSFTVTATGTPTPTLSESGTLPTGVSFNAGSGVLSGTPAAGTAGSYPITFTAQNTGTANNVLVQKKDTYFGNGSGAGTKSIVFTSQVAKADLLFCMVGWETANGSVISSVSDSVGNTYTALPLVVNSPHQMQGFYAFSSGSGADTVTVNFSGAGGTYVGIACGEWSGPTHLDVHGERFGISATPSSATVTPTSSGELLIGYADDAVNAWGATGGWTILTTSSGVRYGLEEQLSSTTGGVAAGFTISTAPWAAGIAAFDGSSGATQSFTLIVNPMLVAPTITSGNNATFTVGTAGSFMVTATGVPAPTLSETGALPAGVTFNAASGVLGGTPTVGGTYPVTITAQNGVGTGATQSFTLAVNQAAAITSGNNAAFTVGAAGSFTVTANGFPSPTLSESGALPAGVTFNAASGVLGGTPTVGGAYPVTFTAHNGVGTDATQAFTLTVNQAASITSSNTVVFSVGATDSFTVTAGGSPTPALSLVGALPTGVSFNSSNGILSGTAAAGTAGTYPITFIAHNGVGADAMQIFTLTVGQGSNAPSITSPNSTSFTVGVTGSFTVTATGSPTPILSEAGALPGGVSFNGTTGVLGGTPIAGTGGVYPITFTAQNGASENTNSFVQKTDAYFPSATGAASKSVVFSSPVSAADLLFCTVGWETGNGSLIGSVSDSIGNTYTALPLVVNSPHQMQGFYAFSSGSGADTITVNFSGAGGIYIGIACGEWSGPTHLDVHAEAIGSSTTPTSGSVTPGNMGELLIGYADDATNTWAARGAWMLRSSATNVRYGLEDQLSSAAGPAAASFSIYGAPWTAGVAAFSSGSLKSTSQNFTLNVVAFAPTITTQPSNQTISAGQTAIFMVAATGSAPLAYQWQKDGLNVSGATSSTYTAPAATGADNGTQFTVIVDNSAGSAVSAAATLTVNTAPSISVSPSNQTVAAGETATFNVSVSVTGNLPLSYQWYKNNITIPGATSQTYTTPAAAQADSGNQFNVVVSNSLGNATSAAATLTVIQPPSPATYYVNYQGGSDTNSGLTKEAAWQRAPGMKNCSSNCSLAALHPGDRVIFKGGVAWDASGFPMVVSASGSSGNPIYYGVDASWYAGGGWTRPVFDLENGTWTEAPILVSFANFVTFDNLEIENEAVDNSGRWPPRGSISVDSGSSIVIENCYIHGWSIQNPVIGSDSLPSGGIAFYGRSVGGVVQNCVLDGSPESDSGVGIYGGASIDGNVIENVPNGIVVTDPLANVSGNQVFDVPYSVDPSASSNAMVVQTSGSIDNNVVHDLVPGAFPIVLQAGTQELGNTQYVYNNLVWNVGDNAPVVIESGAFGPNSPSNQYVYNNTLSGGSSAGCVGVIADVYAPTNLTVQNNHCISELSSAQAWCWNNAGGNFDCGAVGHLIFGNNVLMTTEAAASQGYTLADSFQPAGAGGATVGAGLNLVSSCVPIGSSLCNDRLGVSRPGGTAAWDAGAYEYSTSVNLAPSITLEPVRQEVLAGEAATFSVIAAGTGPLNYQWEKNGTAIAGATSATYTTPAVLATDNGSQFSVVVSNAVGSVSSSPAIVSVSSVPGELTASQSRVDFGSVSVGAAASASVTLTNTSNSYITITNVSITGAGMTASGVPSGIILAPQQAASVSVVFAPAGTGSVAGSVSINSDAAGSPTTIAVTGTGIAPAHAVTVMWDASVSSVFGYNVYRATSLYGPFMELNTTPVTTTEFRDITVVPGQSYLYWVTAVEANTLESPLSDPVSVTVPAP